AAGPQAGAEAGRGAAAAGACRAAAAGPAARSPAPRRDPGHRAGRTAVRDGGAAPALGRVDGRVRHGPGRLGLARRDPRTGGPRVVALLRHAVPLPELVAEPVRE